MDKIKSIGIMTGNSLDAVDVVLNEVDMETNEAKMLASISYSLPAEISDNIRKLRVLLKKAHYNFDKIIDNSDANFEATHNSYIRRVNETITALIQKAIDKKAIADASEISIIGFHGQTLGHFPPSIACGKDPYTTQLGDGQVLADMTGIPVVYDFRSDDIMNNGEGAPLAPMYNYHLTKSNEDFSNVAFCNAGNTGNITIICKDKKAKETKIMGWDTGPFNHFPDYLMRTEQDNEPYDIDGILGSKGALNMKLLNSLFTDSAVTRDGENFFLANPPKSSDPSWYKVVRDLDPRNGIPFIDRLRTAEYFSAYTVAYSLSLIPETLEFPSTFILCGGGWKNPIILQDFKNILSGRGVALPQHDVFVKSIGKRVAKNIKVGTATEFGLSAKYMEAGVFADMAVMRILGKPYTLPSTTGCSAPSVCGVVRYPEKGGEASERVKALIKKYKSEKATKDGIFVDPRLSRAIKGWTKRVK